jgi:phosphatidylinositol glycan class N
MRLIFLFLLGFLLHVASVLCMFDIYFRSPLVHGMAPFPQTTPAPSRRLVLIVGKSLAIRAVLHY